MQLWKELTYIFKFICFDISMFKVMVQDYDLPTAYEEGMKWFIEQINIELESILPKIVKFYSDYHQESFKKLETMINDLEIK